MDGEPQRDCIELQKLMEPGYSDELSVCVQYSNFKTLVTRKWYASSTKRLQPYPLNNLIFGQYFKSVLRISDVHPLCQWLTSGWDVRGMLLTVMMTHCGTVPLILSPALWIQNRLWLTLCTLWPSQSWQERRIHVCYVEKLRLCCCGPSWRKCTFELISTSNPKQCLSWEATAAIRPLSCAACLISAAFDQHPQLQIGLVTVMCWNEPSVLIMHNVT